MIHPSTLVLIDKLCEMTRQKKIAWQMGEDDTIVHDTEGYRVVLTQDPQELILADALGRELERADVQELSETMTQDGQPYAEPVSEMIRDAARVAKGTEFAIEKVLASLDLDGDGIPDLPAPPGMEAMIAEELGDAPTPEEIAAFTTEDVTEETSPFIVAGDTPPAPDTVPEPVAEKVEDFVAEATPEEAAPDVASAVQQMADSINGGTVETTNTPTDGPNLSGFGAFAAGTGALGAMGVTAGTLGNKADNTIETAIDELPDAPSVDITAPAEAVIEDVVSAVPDMPQAEEAVSKSIGRIDDIEGTIETHTSEFGGFPEVPTDTSAISASVEDAATDAAETLSEGEQSIANIVESFTNPEQAETAAPEAPSSKPLNFSLSGIGKGVGAAGLAGAATSAVSNTVSSGTEAVGDAIETAGADAGELSNKVDKAVGGVVGAGPGTLSDAKDAVESTGSKAADGARKIVDDIAEEAAEAVDKPKPTTRFNPWN